MLTTMPVFHWLVTCTSVTHAACVRPAAKAAPVKTQARQVRCHVLLMKWLQLKGDGMAEGSTSGAVGSQLQLRERCHAKRRDAQRVGMPPSHW